MRAQGASRRQEANIQTNNDSRRTSNQTQKHLPEQREHVVASWTHQLDICERRVHWPRKHNLTTEPTIKPKTVPDPDRRRPCLKHHVVLVLIRRLKGTRSRFKKHGLITPFTILFTLSAHNSAVTKKKTPQSLLKL